MYRCRYIYIYIYIYIYVCVCVFRSHFGSRRIPAEALRELGNILGPTPHQPPFSIIIMIMIIILIILMIIIIRSAALLAQANSSRSS